MDSTGTPPEEGSTPDNEQFMGLMAEFEGKIRSITHGICMGYFSFTKNLDF